MKFNCYLFHNSTGAFFIGVNALSNDFSTSAQNWPKTCSHISSLARFSILSLCGLIMKATSEKCIYAANCLLLDLITTGSVGKSADSTFLSASVDDPDDAFVGFTYVAPMEEVLHE